MFKVRLTFLFICLLMLCLNSAALADHHKQRGYLKCDCALLTAPENNAQVIQNMSQGTYLKIKYYSQDNQYVYVEIDDEDWWGHYDLNGWIALENVFINPRCR